MKLPVKEVKIFVNIFVEVELVRVAFVAIKFVKNADREFKIAENKFVEVELVIVEFAVLIPPKVKFVTFRFVTVAFVSVAFVTFRFEILLVLALLVEALEVMKFKLLPKSEYINELAKVAMLANKLVELAVVAKILVEVEFVRVAFKNVTLLLPTRIGV